jgi:hypothetical protein
MTIGVIYDRNTLIIEATGWKTQVFDLRLQEETQMGMYDVIIHNGDFAYDMNDVIFWLKN